MPQYIYEDLYKGQPRKLLIIKVADADEYRVFCDSSLLGILTSELSEDGLSTSWKTVCNILKPIATKIGQQITASQAV